MTPLNLERVRPITIAEYYKMGEIGIFAPDERVELIDGIPCKEEPSTPIHTYTMRELNKTLIMAFSGTYAVWIHNPIILSDYSMPEPDAAIVRDLRKGETPFIPRPEDVYLVVEVSDIRLLFDRTVKVPLYARAEILEVWIIDTTASLIEQYLSPQNGTYQVMNVWRNGDIIPTSLEVGIEADQVLL